MVKMEDEFDTMCKDLSKLIDETEDINKLLQTWEAFNTGLKEARELNDKIRNKIKNYLKERGWKHYTDKESKVSVTITNVNREHINKDQLKILLTNSQYSQILKISQHERLQILTEKNKKELRKIVGRKR